MFRVRDYSIFLPSPNAERSFRKLRRLNLVVNGLLVILGLLCLWNIATLIQLRMISNQDLANVSDIADALSTRLIWLFTILTLGVIVLRELTIGERTAVLIYPLTALLAIVLVPAAMTEIQPALEEKTLQIMMNQCPPKAIVNDTLLSIGRCDPREIRDGDVLLATSDPTDGSFETIDPVSGGQNTITFNMSGRGTYTVYFMFRFEDMTACEHATIFPQSAALSESSRTCIAHDDAAWLVMPHTTAANQQSGVRLVQVTLP